MMNPPRMTLGTDKVHTILRACRAIAHQHARNFNLAADYTTLLRMVWRWHPPAFGPPGQPPDADPVEIVLTQQIEEFAEELARGVPMNQWQRWLTPELQRTLLRLLRCVLSLCREDRLDINGAGQRLLWG